jgi:hypothetical protein
MPGAVLRLGEGAGWELVRGMSVGRVVQRGGVEEVIFPRGGRRDKVGTDDTWTQTRQLQNGLPTVHYQSRSFLDAMATSFFVCVAGEGISR